MKQNAVFTRLYNAVHNASIKGILPLGIMRSTCIHQYISRNPEDFY